MVRDCKYGCQRLTVNETGRCACCGKGAPVSGRGVEVAATRTVIVTFEDSTQRRICRRQQLQLVG